MKRGEMDLTIVHSYEQLANWGLAAHLLCNICKTGLKPKPDFETTGEMMCYGCASSIFLGQQEYNRMKTAVESYELYREYKKE